jgi:hypothetical protein
MGGKGRGEGGALGEEPQELYECMCTIWWARQGREVRPDRQPVGRVFAALSNNYQPMCASRASVQRCCCQPARTPTHTHTYTPRSLHWLLLLVQMLLAAEGVALRFTPAAIAEVARIAEMLNQQVGGRPGGVGGRGEGGSSRWWVRLGAARWQRVSGARGTSGAVATGEDHT